MNFPFLFAGLILAFCDLSMAKQNYRPDEYAAACLGVISTSYHWNGGQCDGVKTKNVTRCHCNMPDFLQTVVSCVDQLTASLADNNNDTFRNDVYGAIVSECQPTQVQLNQLEQFHANASALRPYSGSKEIEEFGECNATVAFEPTLWEANNAIQAYKMSELTVPRSHQAGAAVVAYWGGVALLRFLIHWISVLLPSTRSLADTSVMRTIRRLVTVPPLLARKHSQPQFVTRYFPMNIPTREQSLIIVGFVTLHLGLQFGMLPVHRPSYLYKYNDRWLYCRELGFRAGKLVVFETPLLILFAGRNNFLQWLTSWSHDTFVVYHKWIARSVAFSLLVHAAGHTVDKLSRGSYGALWNVAYWRWGISGGVFCGIIVFQAMYVFRRLSYEFFHVLHVLLAVGFVVAGYYHVKLQESELQYFYAMWAVWAFDWVMRIARILISGPTSKADIRFHDNGGIIEYTIRYSKLWKPRPGDYAFIHIVLPSSFWESHPFTLSRGVLPGEEDCLKIFSRVKNGFTKRMKNKVLERGGGFTANVWIDGPYGPSYKVKEFDEAVFLSGGIGITAPFSYIQGILSDPNSKTKVIKLYWAMGDESPLQWFQHQINYLKGTGRVEIYIFKGGSRRVDPRLEQDKCEEDPEKLTKDYTWTDQLSTRSIRKEYDIKSKDLSQSSSSASIFSVLHEPLNTEAVVRRAITNAEGKLAILSCAPDAINDTARSTVANCLCKAPNYVEYFEESFSW